MQLQEKVWYVKTVNFCNTYWFWLLVSLFIYGWVINSYFVSDDFDFLRNMAGSGHPWWWWLVNPQNPGVLFYRPLHNWYFLLHKWLFGLTAWPYHVSLILAHALSAYILFKALLATRKLEIKIAWLAALLFLLAPVQAESVAWISGGVSVLAGLPALLSFYCWVKARQTGRRWWWILSAVSWFIALLAKESVLTWPLVLLVIDWLILQSGSIREKVISLFRPLVYFAGVGVIYFILRINSLDALLGGYGSAVHSSLDIEAMSKMLGSSIISFFSGGASKYWLTQQMYNYLPGFYLILGVLIALGFIGSGRNRHWYLAGCLVFVISLLPQINLGINMMDTQGERYLYLPAVGAGLVLSLLIFSSKNGSRIGFVLGLLAMIFFGSLLTVRLWNWRAAGEYTKKITEQFSPYVNNSRSQQQIFIGLPDNIGGAFIFRNGFNEALKLTYPNYEPSRWLMPMRVFLNNQQISWEKSGPKISGQSNDLSFTLTNISDYFDQKLIQPKTIEPRYHFVLARGYEIIPNAKFSQVQKKWPIQYFVFDNTGLQLLNTKTVN